MYMIAFNSAEFLCKSSLNLYSLSCSYLFADYCDSLEQLLISNSCIHKIAFGRHFWFLFPSFENVFHILKSHSVVSDVLTIVSIKTEDNMIAILSVSASHVPELVNETYIGIAFTVNERVSYQYFTSHRAWGVNHYGQSQIKYFWLKI